MYFLILQKLQISGKKCWCQSSRGVIYIFYIMSFLSCHLYIFWIFFNQSILVPSFIMVGYVWQILGPRLPPIHEQPLKGPSWIAFLFLKKLQTFRPQHRCIPIAKFLIIPILKNICNRLLYNFFNASLSYKPKASRFRLYDSVRLEGRVTGLVFC